MNNLLLRRRGLMLGGTPPNIAVSVEDNPEFVALIYNAGHCASPEYITVEEAEAFTGPYLPDGKADCPHIDLRHFINYTPAIWSLGGLKYKITLPNKPSPAGVNACLSSAGDGLTVVLPEKVSSIDPYFINDSVHITHATVIIEREIPPTIEGARPKLFATDSTDILVFVPDEAVETYKANTFWGQYLIRPVSLYNTWPIFYKNLIFGKAVGNNFTTGLNTDADFLVFVIPYVANTNYEIKCNFDLTDTNNNIYGVGVASKTWALNTNERLITYFSCRNRDTIIHSTTTQYVENIVLVTLKRDRLADAYILNEITGEYLFKGENV